MGVGMRPALKSGTAIARTLTVDANAHDMGGPSPKVTCAPDSFRPTPGIRVDNALQILPRLERPKLYCERNGKGMHFSRLKYLERDSLGRARPGALYLGQLTPDQVQRLREEIAALRTKNRIPAQVTVDVRERVGMLRRCRLLAFGLARRLAADCGFRFAGFKLRKERAR